MPLKKKNVLIVDHDPIFREFLLRIFEKDGFNAYWSIIDKEMWELLHHRKVDLVVLDVELPGEGGISVLQKLRKSHDMGIIMVSSQTSQTELIRCLKYGADDYINKPINKDELLLRANNLLYRIGQSKTDGAADRLNRQLISDYKQEIAKLREQHNWLRGQYESLINAQKIAKTGSWDWDITNDTLFWSDEIFRIFGLDAKTTKATFDLFISAVHPGDREHVKAVINKTLENESLDYQIKHRIVWPDGNVRYVLERGEVLRDSYGKPLRMIGTVLDVTARKKEEDREIREISSRITISALLETGLENLSLQRQLEIALDIILAIPWLRFINQGAIFITDKNSGDLKMVCNKNLPECLQQSCARIAFGHCLCGQAAATRQIVFSDKVDHQHTNLYDGMENHGHLCVPIISKNVLLGILNLYLPPFHKHDPEEEAFMSTVANTLAGLIERRHTEEELAKTQERLHHNAHNDALTKLPNRMYLSELLDLSIARARRDNTLMAVLFIDLDRFKLINDTLGHDIGDLLLVEASKRIKECLRESDVLARLGGDEFIAILSIISGKNEVGAVAQRIIDSLKSSFILDGNNCQIGSSIGIAFFPGDGKNQQELLKSADLAMYEVKKRGRNHFLFFDSKLYNGE
ncbi:MAG: diguanylate cyclase [Magnetococcales bacterium]|nr:diguanylate cyclase [Magnetococcales bacterium]